MMAFYVKLRKLREDAASVGYSFVGDECFSGEAVIDKHSGEVTVTRGIAGAQGEAVGLRAAAKLRTEWRRGRMPDTVEWAS